MSVSQLFEPLTLLHGPAMRNRFMLGPLTNQQSGQQGEPSAHDLAWAEVIGRGGYGLAQTCASTVRSHGRAFLRQMGIHDDAQLAALEQIAASMRAGGGLTAVQIHHAGHRAQPALGGVPTPVSDGVIPGVRGMTIDEVEALRDDYVRAAKRAELAGFDGVAIHGAFGFAVSEFLSPLLNRRADKYGGSLENRSRFLFEIIDGIRRACGPQFQIGVRISVERFGLQIEELREVMAEVFRQAKIDYLDLALWDSRQMVSEGPFAGRTALSLFTDLPRHGVRVGTAGKIRDAQRAGELMDEGCDFVVIGRAGILKPDFPLQVAKDHSYVPPQLPVTREYLEGQGVSPLLINYMETAWDGFVVPRAH